MTLRAFISLTLALALVLTSQAMASVRGASEATGQAVLCIDGAMVTVHLDAEGQPTKAPHYCPECMLLALASASVPPGAVLAVAVSPAVFDLLAPQAVPVLCGITLRTRAPPPSV